MISEIIFIISELCLAYVIYRAVKAMSGNLKTNRLLAIGSCLGYSLITALSYRLLNIPLVTLATNVICLYIICLNYEGRIKNYVFRTIAVYILLAIAETFAMILMNQTFTKVAAVNEVIIEDNVILVARLIQFFIVFIMERLIIRRHENEMPLYHMLFFIFVGAVSIYLKIVLCVVMQERRLLLMITSICIVAVNFAMIIIYEMLEREMAENRNNQLIKLKNQAYENEMQLMLKNDNDIRILKHDIKNHWLIVNSFLEDNKTDKAKEYLADMIERINNNQRLLQSENPGLDALINYKMQEAQKDNIEVTIESKIPRNLKIKDIHLTAIVGNLLDNAVSAAKNAEKPRIDICLSYSKCNLIITISNTYDGELIYKNDKLVTKKHDKHLHGLGLKSVEQEILSVGGYFDISHDKESFIVKVMLPVSE